MMKRRRLLIATVVLLAAVVAAFVAEAVLSPPGSYSVAIVREGRVLERFGIEALESMEARRVVMQGKLEEGPPLLSVLRAAGVEGFSSVELRGPGARDDGFLRLATDEIDGDVLLDLANRGTVKVCGPDIDREDRVRDVTEIVVR